MPSQLSHAAVGDALQPALADGVGDGVAVDGCGAGLKIAVIAVQELVPEALARLQGAETGDMFLQLVEDERAVGVVLGQHIQQFHGGEQCPAVGACPVVGGLLCQSFDVAVAVDPLLRNPHAFDEVLIHRGCLVEVLRVVEVDAGVGNGGDAHVHIIEPDGVVLRTVAGEHAVFKAVLAVLYELEVVVDAAFEAFVVVLHHGCTHRAAVIECTGMHDLLQLCGFHLDAGGVTLLCCS